VSFSFLPVLLAPVKVLFEDTDYVQPRFSPRKDDLNGVIVMEMASKITTIDHHSNHGYFASVGIRILSFILPLCMCSFDKRWQLEHLPGKSFFPMEQLP